MPPSFQKDNLQPMFSDPGRLETPSMAGYRTGMSSSGVIGRKLGSVYGVQANLPQELDQAIRQLHSKLGRNR